MEPTSTDCEQIYSIRRWGEGYFRVNARGHLAVRPNPEPAPEQAPTRPGGPPGGPPGEIDLVEATARLRAEGLSLPVLVRFNDILRHRVRRLHAAFARAREAADYTGRYEPCYPIKVNQQRSVVHQILAEGLTGLEAGSKPELMAVLALSRPGGLIVCNGYKDREYVRLALIGQRLGLRVHLVIEKPSEVALILEEARRLAIEPRLGVRLRLAAAAAGNWQNSGGEKAKFGLSASQVLRLVAQLRDAGCLDWLRLLHAHLGSQIPNLQDIRDGVRELARFYAELRRLGAPIDTLDVGGGLGVDYEGTRSRAYCSVNYSPDGYAEAIVTTLAEACRAADLPHPNLVTESGRALSAHHAVLITDVIDREEAGGRDVAARPDEGDPRLDALARLLEGLAEEPPLEAFERGRELLGAVRAAFEAGELDLPARARAEELFYALCRALQARLRPNSRRQRELWDRINALLADRLFCNFSLFQSLPDVWAIDQIFPIVPLQRLDETPTARAVVNDLTCDSDGCIAQYVDQDGVEASLPVHAPRAGEGPYLLGFFLVGAYQEILGDIHNLFGDTDAVNLELDPNDPAGYRLLEPERGDSADELLSYVHFEPRALLAHYRRKLDAAGLDRPTREQYYVELKAGLFGYTYLES
ncbi:biosynthetic arginine decarboxylase [Thiococcus pfennigii]|uniref:biosynthetic arginine decarboxylase n=2 Tax=Thiococcus pfennigii TaxID=1057 RepID=UPI0030B89D5E|nr:arginine decarboxylase [Thiococcus pfennigii]